MRKKKKFFNTNVGKVLKGAASVLAPKLVSVLEGTSTLEEAMTIIKGSDVSEETKIQLEKIALDYESELTKRLESDNAQELWLPKLVRPLTLVALVSGYLGGFFFNYDVSVMHAPLMTVFGFYFGGRTLEKTLNRHK